MPTLGLILSFTFFGSVVSLIGVVLFLRRDEWIKKSSSFFASFAAGVLLAISFFDLFPEAVREYESVGADISSVFLFALLGFFIFFLIERAFHWHHHHEGVRHHSSEAPPYRYLIMIGDFFHNFLDGITMAAAFLISPALGIATAISVFFHEIPKEIGDVSLLIHSGMSRRNAILFNLSSTVTAFIGAILAFFLADKLPMLGPLFAFAAGSFLYISASDLIPEIQEETRSKKIITQVLLLVSGIIMMWTLGQLLPHG